jgi:hypothetical protein
VGGRCGPVSLPPTPSYGLRPSDGRIGPPARRCLVLLLQSGGGASPMDVKAPGLNIWWNIDRMNTCATESYME